MAEDPNKPERTDGYVEPGHVQIVLDFDMLTGVLEVRTQCKNPNFCLALIELARLNLEDFKRAIHAESGPRVVPANFLPGRRQ